MWLITGASGSLGGLVLEAARKKGGPIRATYRSAEDAKSAPAGVSAVVADYADAASLDRALSGVTAAFVVCSPTPELVALESSILDACKRAGVGHVVLQSALGAGEYGKSFPSWHRQVEDRLEASGLSSTILRPNGFMQNIVAYDAPSIRKGDAFYAAMGDAKVSLIDAHDIADVAVKALDGGAHARKTYELSGPETLTTAEVATRISRVAHRPVQFVDIPETAQRKAMRDAGMPEWQVTALLELQQYYRQGGGARSAEVLESLLGRAPRRLDAFLDANAGAFTKERAA